MSGGAHQRLYAGSTYLIRVVKRLLDPGIRLGAVALVLRGNIEPSRGPSQLVGVNRTRVPLLNGLQVGIRAVHVCARVGDGTSVQINGMSQECVGIRFVLFRKDDGRGGQSGCRLTEDFRRRVRRVDVCNAGGVVYAFGHPHIVFLWLKDTKVHKKIDQMHIRTHWSEVTKVNVGAANSANTQLKEVCQHRSTGMQNKQQTCPTNWSGPLMQLTK